MLHSKSYIQSEKDISEVIRLLYNEIEELERKIEDLEDKIDDIERG